MRYIGYANMAHIDEHSSNVVRELSEKKCSVVYLESRNSDNHAEWNHFIDELNDGDVAVIFSFGNVFHNYTEVMHFLKMCSTRKIRIISIHDEIDTSDTITSDILTAITKVVNSNKEEVHDDVQAELVIGTKRNKKLKKHRTIVNMYNAGFSIKDIMNKTNCRSKSNLYRILHLYDVQLEYPAMSRKTKERKKAAAVV